MEKSESEEIFDSLNLNPRLFLNSVLNSVDDLVDGAFDHFHQEASKLIGTEEEGTDRSHDLNEGVAYLKNMVQSVLDKRLSIWEKYCQVHCFSVPEGFSLPKTTEPPGESSINQKIQYDRELDEQLDSLRNEIVLEVKKTAEHDKQVHEQKRKLDLDSQLALSVTEASQLNDQNSALFEELKKTTAELREKMKQLKVKRLKQDEHRRIEKMSIPATDVLRTKCVDGLSNVTTMVLEEFMAEIKNI